MKKFKRIMALVIALAMVVAMALPAMAATIKVNETETAHEYSVYQIFTGTLFEETDSTTGVTTKTLSDIKYGTNYQASGKNVGDLVPKAELDAILALTETDKAREYATNLLDGNDANGEISGTAVGKLNSGNSYTLSDLADGYYLIVDDTTKTLATGDMFSRYIVQVIGDVEIAPKKSTVEEHKNITADTHNADTANDSPSVTTGEDISTDKSADDVSIGEDVTFTIDATVPLSAADYEKFFFVINDTLSEGLTLKTDSFRVYTKSASGQELAVNTSDYTLFLKGDTTHPADSGKTFQIAIKDAQTHAGTTYYIEYKATLNEKAAIGETPNTNKTTVTYSNNPENDYDGEDNNNDGKPDDMTKAIYGNTPEQETKTFTSSIQLKKVKEDGTPLQGAEFQITGTSVKTVVVTTDVYTAVATGGTYYKLKDGTYTDVEPAETDTYVSKGTGKSDGGYVKVPGENGNPDTYRVATYDELNDTTTEIFKKVTGTASLYEDKVEGEYVMYKKEKKSETVETTSTVKAKAFVDASGIVRFDGLGSGTYTISETTVPDGYNKIDDITVVITFDKNDADKDTTNNATPDDDAYVWSATSEYVETSTNTTGTITEIDSDDDDSVVDTFQIQVVNKKGTVLPSTGGIGTTIFYVVGAILVIGAGVVLITRRRMDA